MKNKNGKMSCSSIGCILVLALLGMVFFAVRSCSSHISEQARKANAVARQRSQHDDLSEPDSTVVDLMFRKSLRDYLHDPGSYTPGLLRHGAHPKGYAFIQEFKAKNALGAMIKQSAGLLAATNTGTIAWTFYTPEQTPALLREVMAFKAETDPKIKAFKESVEEAKKNISPQ